MQSRRVIYRLMLPLLMGCATACGNGGEPEPAPTWRTDHRVISDLGWTYRPERTAIIYRFGDASWTEFSGICMGKPILMLRGGDYPSSATTFELVIDGKSSFHEVFDHQHGRFLPMDDTQIIQRLADAEQKIKITVGPWSKNLPVSPLLRRFVRDCEKALSADLPTQTFR